MSHPRLAALLRAAVASLVILGAACAHARAAFAFEVIPRATPPHRSYFAAYACALAGAGLLGSSFPLGSAADRRYSEYLRETDIAAIGSRWDASVRADRVASGSLIAGEALVVTGVWLRFIRRPHEPRVALVVTPERCAFACSF